ncbi:MAG: PASTA domain-containing protein [Solirubrobacteraceae bacterium]
MASEDHISQEPAEARDEAPGLGVGVEELAGMRAGEAVAAVRRLGLRPQLERVEGYAADVHGLVVSQEPAQGARLQAGSGVRLFVAAPARMLTGAEETEEQEQTRAPEAAASAAAQVEDDEAAESVAAGVGHLEEEGGAWARDGLAADGLDGGDGFQGEGRDELAGSAEEQWSAETVLMRGPGARDGRPASRDVSAEEDWIGSLPSRRAADEVAPGLSRRKGHRAAGATRARAARRAVAARRWRRMPPAVRFAVLALLGCAVLAMGVSLASGGSGAGRPGSPPVALHAGGGRTAARGAGGARRDGGARDAAAAVSSRSRSSTTRGGSSRAPAAHPAGRPSNGAAAEERASARSARVSAARALPSSVATGSGTGEPASAPAREPAGDVAPAAAVVPTPAPAAPDGRGAGAGVPSRLTPAQQAEIEFGVG